MNSFRCRSASPNLALGHGFIARLRAFEARVCDPQPLRLQPKLGNNPTRPFHSTHFGTQSRGPEARRSRLPSPEGTPENSPPFQRWVLEAEGIESRREERNSARWCSRQRREPLLSLRDSAIFPSRSPSVETSKMHRRPRNLVKLLGNCT